MEPKSGVCGNFGNCRKADRWESIPIYGDTTLCPECGRQLTFSGASAQGRSGRKSPGSLRAIVLTLGAGILFLAGIGVYLAWPDSQSRPASPTESGEGNPPAKKQELPPKKSEVETEKEKQKEPTKQEQQGPTPEQKPSPRQEPPKQPRTFSAATLQARLLSTISTRTSKERDPFTARVEGGPCEGAMLAGHITRIERKKKQAKIAFQFETISLQGRAIPIQAELKQVANAKGVKNVDEENRVVGTSSKKKTFLAGAVGGALGGVWGAIKGGGKGAAAGAATGAGAGVILSLTLVTQADEIHFAPGTLFTIEASEGRAR